MTTTPLNSPRCANNRSRDCNLERSCPEETRVSTAVVVRLFGRARQGGLRPCRHDSNVGIADLVVCPPTLTGGWLPTQSAEGKTMDQPTQAVPIPRGHRPARSRLTRIAQHPPSGGAR